MPPIREYENWSKRYSDTLEEIDPLRKYVFICEGQNSEVFYIRELIQRKGQLNLDPLVDIRLWEKTEKDAGISRPKALLHFAHEQRRDKSLGFREGQDKMVVVFDVDVYCRVGANRTGAAEAKREFNELLNEVTDSDILAFTNPSFELFLMLHKEDSFNSIVKPNAEELLANKFNGSRRYAQKLFTDNYHMNPKKNPRIGNLVEDLDIAIEQEKYLNHSLDRCLYELSSNVGEVINAIRNEQLSI